MAAKPGCAEVIKVVAHDINNLLAVIRGYFDFASLEKENLSAEMQYSLDIASRAAVDITDFVSDVVDVARMEEGSMALNVAPADIDALIRDAAKKASPAAADASVEIVVRPAPGPADCAVDKRIFLRIMAYLIRDAVRWSSSGGQVEIRARIRGDGLEVAVEDGGMTIPPAYRDKIFKKESLSEIKDSGMQRGRGLDLVFCRLATELHGGTMRIEPGKDGTGNIFIFRMPRTRHDQKKGERP